MDPRVPRNITLVKSIRPTGASEKVITGITIGGDATSGGDIGIFFVDYPSFHNGLLDIGFMWTMPTCVGFFGCL